MARFTIGGWTYLGAYGWGGLRPRPGGEGCVRRFDGRIDVVFIANWNRTPHGVGCRIGNLDGVLSLAFAPGTVGIAHQDLFDAVGFLSGIMPIDDGRDFGYELIGVTKAGQDAWRYMGALLDHPGFSSNGPAPDYAPQ